MADFTDNDIYSLIDFDILGDAYIGQCIVAPDEDILYPGLSSAYGYETSLVTFTSEENQEYFGTGDDETGDGVIIDDLNKRDYPGIVWPHKGLKMELLYVYLDNELQNRNSTNCNLEIFLIDGAELEGEEFKFSPSGGIPSKPCSTFQDGHGCDNAYEDYRWWRFQWLENDDESDYHTRLNWWFDLTLSENINLPTIEQIFYTPLLGDAGGYDYYNTCDRECVGLQSGWSEGWMGGWENYTDIAIIYNTGHLATDAEAWGKYVLGTVPTNHPNSAKNFYIVVRTGASQDKWWGAVDERRNTYQTFVLPKSDFEDLVFGDIEEKTIGWGDKLYKFRYPDPDNDDPRIIDKLYSNVPDRETDDYGTDSGVTGAVFRCQGLAVRLTIPEASKNNFDNDIYPANYEDDYGWPVWINTPQILNELSSTENFNPNKYIDYTTFAINGESFTENNIQDFRPISNVYISAIDQPVMLQRYYDTSDPFRQFATALNKVEVSFDISKTFGDITYLNGAKWGSGDNNGDVNSDSYQDKQIGYMFRVVRWGDENDINDAELDYKLIEEYGQMDISDYPYRSVREKEGGGDYGILNHFYFDGGVKIIKAFVFSYIYHPDSTTYPDHVQALRWKLVTIKLYIDDPSYEITDFSTLGGYDFITYPWPYTAPIVSGISENSKYMKSLDVVLDSGLFGEHEMNQLGELKLAYQNNEMGTYLGKTDLEQVRVFITGSYDMNTLLGINPITDTDGWHPYTDVQHIPAGAVDTFTPIDSGSDYTTGIHLTSGGSGTGCKVFVEGVGTGGNITYMYIAIGGEGYQVDDILTITPMSGSNGATFTVSGSVLEAFWDGNVNQFLSTTSVGQRYITKNEDIELRNNCILELNLGEIDSDAVHDSAGRGNKGVLIGDYGIKKQSSDLSVTRETFMNPPRRGNDKKAL